MTLALLSGLLYDSRADSATALPATARHLQGRFNKARRASVVKEVAIEPLIRITVFGRSNDILYCTGIRDLSPISRGDHSASLKTAWG